MKMRIVLSLFALALLAAGGSLGFGAGVAAAANPAPPAPPTDNGIGTSPSVEVQAYPEVVTCGIWIDSTPELADARSRAGEPPDIVVSPTLYASCWDAVMIGANLYAGRSFVRALVYQGWRAREAPTPHAALHLAQPAEWRAATLQRSLPIPMRAAFPLLAVLAIVVPLIQTVIGKIFAGQVKDANRRTEIAGYVDTAFHLVELLGPQLGLTGHEKYLRFIQQIVDSLNAAGSPELSGKEMAQLQQKAAVKSMLAKTRAVLPARPPMPLPPPRG